MEPTIDRGWRAVAGLVVALHLGLIAGCANEEGRHVVGDAASSDGEKDASGDADAGAGGDSSADAGGDGSEEAGEDAGGDTGADSSGDASGDSSADASGDSSADASGDSSGEAGADASGDSSADGSGDSSADASADAAGDSDGSAGGPRSVFQVPLDWSSLAEGTFFDHPWPSDLRRHADGRLMAAGLPRPRGGEGLEVYAAALEALARGFSPNAAGYLRFDTDLDESSLPADPLATLDPEAVVQLVDVDPASPERGARRPIALHVRNAPGVYWPGRVLAFLPAPGHPLRHRTRYAAVVTRGARASTGESFAPSTELESVLGASPPPGPLSAAAQALAPSVAELEAAGIARADLVHLAVFTTDDPVWEAEVCRDHLVGTYPPPTVEPTSWARAGRVTGSHDVYEGVYGPSPIYQRGVAPYLDWGSGGELALDSTGTPEVVATMDLRFALSVPSSSACPQPASGYPIVLYAHGTGGSYRSFLSREAGPLAARCIAMMGIDQIFHGTRPGADSGLPPEFLLFNISNPAAARANLPQSALDVVQQARLFTVSATEVPAATAYAGAAIRFDAARLSFFGHSQGGLNGPIFLALDDQARGGVLSGSGSMLSITVMDRKDPFDLLTVVAEGVLQLQGAEIAEVNLFHPWMSAVQTLADPGDPLAYLSRLVREPRAGFAPKSLLMTEGVRADGAGDSSTPPRSTEVQAVAIGLPVISPAIHPPELTTSLAPAPLVVPPAGVTGNLAGGLASGALVQWDPGAGEGHFVLYQVPGAMTQAADFSAALALDPIGRVPAPW